VHPSRDAAARGEQRLDGNRRDAVGRSVQPGDPSHRVRVERLKRDRVVRVEPRERGRLLAGGHHQQRQCPERTAELAQRGPHLGGRAIGIVEHQQHGPG
jgi:hypothetical protein